MCFKSNQSYDRVGFISFYTDLYNVTSFCSIFSHSIIIFIIFMDLILEFLFALINHYQTSILGVDQISSILLCLSSSMILAKFCYQHCHLINILMLSYFKISMILLFC